MKKINTALCSFGMSGWVFHAPFINIHPGFNFYGVWERTKSLAREQYPGVNIFRDLDSMLSDKKIELVVVNTPNYTHYQYVRKALEAGKHVIVEKPFTVTVEEGEELIAIATSNNLKLSVYHNRRYDSDYKTIRKVLQERLLGDIIQVEMHFDRFKEELSPKVHKETPGPGTGALYDLGSHLVDQALQLFGSPEAVFADIRTVRPISKVDDYFDVLLYYPALRVRLKSSYQVREPLPGYIIHGSKGSFIKSKTDVQEMMLQANVSPATEGWGTEPATEKGLLHTERNGEVIREYIDSLTGNYGDYYSAIYEAIRNDAPLPVTATEGLQVVKVIVAAFKSSNERKVITL